MDHNSSQSNIPLAKFRLRPRSFQTQHNNSSFNNSYVNHFNTDQLDESSRFNDWNLSYLKDAKKCINESVYYLKNEVTKRSWFRSKRKWSIIMTIILILISYKYFNNLFIEKYTELENEIKSIRQIMLKNDLNRFNKSINEINEINEINDEKFNLIKIENLLESTNFNSNLEEMINNKINKIENIENKIKELINDELDFKMTNLINSKLEEQLNELKNQIYFELTEKLIRRLDEQINKQINEKLKHSTSLSTDRTSLDRTSLDNSIETVIYNLVLDKESKPDYASELNNAIILDSSPTFIESNAVTFLSIPLWSTSGSPNNLLKRNPNLFEYYPKPWKMNSNKGFIQIKLAKSIIPESFIYEHVIKSSILDENQLTCSPKIFNVIGYKDENLNESISLGKFNFKLFKDESKKTEFLFDKIAINISIIQFNIEDNYGNSNYTCMHRLKVF